MSRAAIARRTRYLSRLASFYGSAGKVRAVFLASGGKCGCCGRRFAVDDPVPHKLGLLCQRCGSLMRHKAPVLRAAADFLNPQSEPLSVANPPKRPKLSKEARIAQENYQF